MIRLFGVIGFVCGMFQAFAAAHAQQVPVEIVRLDGKQVSGRWVGASDPRRVALRTPIREETYALDELMLLRVLSSPDPAAIPGDWPLSLWTNDGSYFPARLSQVEHQRLHFGMPFAESLEISLSDLAAISWNHHPVDQSWKRLLQSRSTTTDVLLAIDGDQLRAFEGTLVALSPEGGQFSVNGRSVAFNSDKAYGLVLAGRPLAPRPVVCQLTNDTILTGELRGTTEHAILLECLGAQQVEIPLSVVRTISFNSERLLYLSELTPQEVQVENVFDVTWPVRFDRAVSNRPLQMNGRLYTRGIGVHADTRITYALNDSYRFLAATIGIDDYARPHGHAVFLITSGDGRELFRSDSKTGRCEPEDIIVPIADVNQLTLIVESSSGLDLGDHADWAQLRLIR